MSNRPTNLWTPETPTLWLPRKAGPRGTPLIETPSVMGITGHVTMRLRDARTGIIKRELSFRNKLTNQFIGGGIFGVTGGFLSYSSSSAGTATQPFGLPAETNVAMQAGSGTTPPTAADSALVTPIALQSVMFRVSIAQL